MYSEIILFDKLVIKTFDICLGIGLILFLLVFLYLAIKKMHYNKQESVTMAEILVVSLLFAYIFAILFDSLLKLKVNDGKFVIKTMNFYGGLIGGVGAFIILTKQYKKRQIPLLDWLNIIVPGLIIAHFFGRIGCFMAGCCFGKVTDSAFGVVFPEGALSNYVYYPGAKVYPTQLFEAFGLLILFILVYFVFKRYRIYIYMMGYGIIRFIIEFFRGDERGTLGVNFLSPAQIISIILLISGLVLYLISIKKRGKSCINS